MNTPAQTLAGRAALAAFRNPYLLWLIIAVLVVAGASALLNLPRIEDPRITERVALVLTFLPGATAERVEALVTEKLEDALDEISEIKHLESTSRNNVSLITIELEDRVGPDDNENVFSKIRDKLGEAERLLPEEASRPLFDDKRGAVAYSLIVALNPNQADGPSIGQMARHGEVLADRLRAIPGTELVRLYGAPEEEISVRVDPAELAAVGLSAPELARRLAAADAKQPAGTLRSDSRDLAMEVAGEFDSVARVASIPIAIGEGGGQLRLGDLGAVVRAWREPPDDLAYHDGKRAVFVAARVEPESRVDEWAVAAADSLNAFRVGTGAAIDAEIVFNQSFYTQQRLSVLSSNLLAGAALVVLVVLLGMGWRSALIVGAALPLSAASTLFGLTLIDEPIHQMSIFGMIIAIGLLIDNAIVVTDEVQQRLGEGDSRAAAVAHAVDHLSVPLAASTFTTILAFMPIFLLPGNVGDFVAPIAQSVVLALTASFCLSVTVIAALAGRYANRRKPGNGDNFWRQGIGMPRAAKGFRELLHGLVERPGRAIAMSVVLPVLGFVLAGTLGNEFFPPAERDHFEIEVFMPADSAVTNTAAIATRIEAQLRSHPEIRQVDWLIGGSFPQVYYNKIMRQDRNAAYAQAVVRADSLEAAEDLLPELQQALDVAVPEAQVLVRAFGQGPPVRAPVAYRIFGPDPRTLRELGEALRRVMHEVPGILHTQTSIDGGLPKLVLDASEPAAQLAGLTLNDVAAQLQGNLEGFSGGSVLEDLEELPVRVRYPDERRDALQDVAGALVVTRDGWLPAEALGAVRLEPELDAITRRDGQRYNDVLGFIRHGQLAIDVSRAVLAQVADSDFELPPGYRLEVAGDTDEQGKAIRLLTTYLPVLCTLMAATLILSFRSLLLGLSIVAVATLSAGLGMLSLWFAGFPIGFNPIIGSTGLIGVAINGSIVVLAAIRANRDARAGHPDAIVAQTMSSTRHILSTTITTVGGFIPLLVFTGGDFWPPLAVVIAGGVAFSVTLSLGFTPAVYRWLTLRGLVGQGASPYTPVTEGARA
ncbi:MAG: efflux RND transporter permease subunit [Chromatiales bacterium]|nr:MAG: efflux RND transporter permease subunit [Chromatiales bacterium]